VAIPVVIAKNTTVGDIFLTRLGINVPASPGQVTLSGVADAPATYFEVCSDESLVAAVAAGDITINDGSSDLSVDEGGAYLEASGNLNGPVSGAAVGRLLRLLDPTGRYTEAIDIVMHDAAAADPGASSDGALYYNTTIDMWMSYDLDRGKWLSLEGDTFQVGQSGNIPVGTYLKGVAGKTLSSTLGYTAPYNGTIVSMSFSQTNADDTDFEAIASGVQIGTLDTGGDISGYDNTLDGDFSQGDVLAVRNDAAGEGARDPQVWVRMKWRA